MRHLIAIILIIASFTAAAQGLTGGTWIITPDNGSGMQTIIDPKGGHHTIFTPKAYGYSQPGWNQYPNPVDGFFQNYRRGYQFGQFLRNQ